jgi:hypothetical protein
MLSQLNRLFGCSSSSGTNNQYDPLEQINHRQSVATTYKQREVKDTVSEICSIHGITFCSCGHGKLLTADSLIGNGIATISHKNAMAATIENVSKPSFTLQPQFNNNHETLFYE